MDEDMTAREHMILLVSDDVELRDTARHELETIDERRHVSTVSTVDAARRIVEDAAPAVILLTEAAEFSQGGDLRPPAERLDVAVSSLATYAPVVVIGDAEHQTELSGLVAAGSADYVVRTGGCLTIALGLVERRLRQAQKGLRHSPPPEEALETLRKETVMELDREDFGEVLRHELNNPLTGILGNAELLLSEIQRKSDGRLPQGAPQRLETIAALAVRLRESVRRLSTEWESRQNAVHTS
jgi:signal transduction histidine kinase